MKMMADPKFEDRSKNEESESLHTLDGATTNPGCEVIPADHT